MSTRDLRLRIVFRQIYLRKDIRHRISSSDQIVVLLQRIYRRREFRGAFDHQPCSRRGLMIDLGMNTLLGYGLLRSAECTEQIRCDDALAAETAEHRLIRETHRNRSLGYAECQVAGAKVCQML